MNKINFLTRCEIACSSDLMDIEPWLEKISPNLYWLFIFFSSFIENIFPPYPGDTVTVLGGYLVSREKLSLLAMANSVFIGSLLGALLMYYFGQKVLFFLTHTFRIEFIAKELEQDKFIRAQEWFKRNSFTTVVFSRFSAGIRFFVSIIARITQMNVFIFMFAFSLATIIWNTLLIWGGYSLGDNWLQVLEYLKIYNRVVITIIVLGVLFFLGYKYKIHRKKKKGHRTSK